MRPSQHSPRARQMHERLRVIWQWQLTDIPETVNRLDMTTTAQTIQQVFLRFSQIDRNRYLSTIGLLAGMAQSEALRR